jgi:hypothetical protein
MHRSVLVQKMFEVLPAACFSSLLQATLEI